MACLPVDGKIPKVEIIRQALLFAENFGLAFYGIPYYGLSEETGEKDRTFSGGD